LAYRITSDLAANKFHGQWIILMAVSNSDAANVMKAGNGSVVVACNIQFFDVQIARWICSQVTKHSGISTFYKIQN
jgi:hypothetical protein